MPSCCKRDCRLPIINLFFINVQINRLNVRYTYDNKICILLI